MKEESNLFLESNYRLWYVTNYGNVYSVYKSTRKIKYIKKRKDSHGELIVHVNGKNFQIKTLVAKYFSRKWKDGCFVKVLDGNKENLKIDNLDIIDRKSYFKKLQNKRVCKPVGLFENGKLLKSWNSIGDCAKDLFYDKSNLAKVLRENIPFEYDIRYL